MPERTLPADAGRSLADVVTGPFRGGQVLGAFPDAVYVAPDDAAVIAIETVDGVGLPNALRLQQHVRGLDLGAVPTGAEAVVGGGLLRIGHLAVAVDRWVDHTYRPAGVDVVVLDRRLREVESVLAVPEPFPAGLVERIAALREALSDGATATLVATGGALLGLGPGLTPSGDDVLCGLLGGGRTIATALGAARLDRALHDAGVTLAALAPERTTAVSAALIAHAAGAELSRPACGLLRALLGRTPVAPALDALLAVGHSSGRDLAVGLAMGVRAALEAAPLRTAPGGTR